MRIFAKGWSNGFDGPGRRFVYYMKGCDFRCLWCASPESISPDPEILFYPDKSEFAASCCDKKAVEGDRLKREICSNCNAMSCINIWRNRAFELVGTDISKSEIIQDMEQRMAMFGSDGGITFSGGEPTLQVDELLDIAQELKYRGINLTIETNAASPRFKELYDAFDLLICDLKCITPELHYKITGAANDMVVKNISHAVAAGINMIIRVPLIEELNFTISERERFYEFFSAVKPARVEFLRLHQLGLPKYKALGQSCPAKKLNPPKEEEVDDFCKSLSSLGIDAKLLH
ncbi:MAG: glycyl-radical enzyme activating protein [Victivallaceae bacterium]|nr:glycyl-radical enzyme activating protein [Victivallaceae bacterium]